MDLFDQLENIKSLEVVYGPPMHRLFDGFGRHDNIYNLGPYVPNFIFPNFGDESKTTYEIKDPVVTEVYLRYDLGHDRLGIEVRYDCENKIVNVIHGDHNAQHLQVCCDIIENAEIKSQFLNGIENKFDLNRLNYEIKHGVPHEQLDFNNIQYVSVMEIQGEHRIQIITNHGSAVYKILD